MGFPLGAPVPMVGSRGAKKVNPPTVMEDEVSKFFSSSYIEKGKDRVVSFVHTSDIARKTQKRVSRLESVMRSDKIIEEEEVVDGILEEQGKGKSEVK